MRKIHGAIAAASRGTEIKTKLNTPRLLTTKILLHRKFLITVASYDATNGFISLMRLVKFWTLWGEGSVLNLVDVLLPCSVDLLLGPCAQFSLRFLQNTTLAYFDMLNLLVVVLYGWHKTLLRTNPTSEWSIFSSTKDKRRRQLGPWHLFDPTTTNTRDVSGQCAPSSDRQSTTKRWKTHWHE